MGFSGVTYNEWQSNIKIMIRVAVSHNTSPSLTSTTYGQSSQPKEKNQKNRHTAKAIGKTDLGNVFQQVALGRCGGHM